MFLISDYPADAVTVAKQVATKYQALSFEKVLLVKDGFYQADPEIAVFFMDHCDVPEGSTLEDWLVAACGIVGTDWTDLGLANV